MINCGTLRQNQEWSRTLEQVRIEMERASGERGPTKAENLVQYAQEQVDQDVKQLQQPTVDAS